MSSTKQEVGLDGDTVGSDYVSKLNYDIKSRTIVVLLLGVKSSIVQSSRKFESKSEVGPKKKLAHAGTAFVINKCSVLLSSRSSEAQ